MTDKISKEISRRVSRRAIIQSAAAAAALTLCPSTTAALEVLPTGPIDYGTGNGQTHLDNTNIFPLLTAWTLLTTNGDASTVDPKTIASVANITDVSAKTILSYYTDKSYAVHFSKVREAFGMVAQGFATEKPYSDGQCPDAAATVQPIASLPCTIGPASSNKKRS
jgi:hypothetical protein